MGKEGETRIGMSVGIQLKTGEVTWVDQEDADLAQFAVVSTKVTGLSYDLRNGVWPQEQRKEENAASSPSSPVTDARPRTHKERNR